MIGRVRRLSRARELFPILVLTRRDETETEIKVLEAGASDFITQPFLPGILLVRLHAMILAWQRHRQRVAAMLLQHGPLTLDLLKAEVRVEGKRVELASAEFRFIKYLMMTKRAMSREELISHLWDSDSGADKSDLQSLVRRVRISLDPEQKIEPIRTVKGIGGYGLRDFTEEA